MSSHRGRRRRSGPALPAGLLTPTPARQPARHSAARHRAAASSTRFPTRTVVTATPIVGAAAVAAAAGLVGFQQSSLAGHAATGTPLTLSVQLRGATIDVTTATPHGGLTDVTGSGAQRTSPASSHPASSESSAASVSSAARIGSVASDAGRASTTRAQRSAAANQLADAHQQALDRIRSQVQKQNTAEQAAAAARQAAAEQRGIAAGAIAGKTITPVTGYHITATFNQGGSHWSRRHTGLDFAVPSGTPVHPVENGVVIKEGWAGAYGNRIEVKHADGTVTWYCHLSSFSANVGDQVTTSDVIALSGATGNVTGPHVHLEVHPHGGTEYESGDAVDPMTWLEDHGVHV